MRILLDTHALLWALFEPEKLNEKAKQLLQNPKNDILVSSVSLWETEIKHLRRPETMPYNCLLLEKAIFLAEFVLIPVTIDHIQHLEDFINQGIHRDPFDHLILATAVSEQCTLLTHDQSILQYRNVMIEQC